MGDKRPDNELEKLQKELSSTKAKVKELNEENDKLKNLNKNMEKQIETLKTALSNPDASKEDEDKLLFKKAAKGMIFLQRKSREGKDFNFSTMSEEDKKALMDLQQVFMKLVVKHKINFTNPQSIIESENGRKFISEMLNAYFDELGTPLDTFQISKIDQILKDMAAESKKVDDQQIGKLEKKVLKIKLSEKFSIEGILTQEQFGKFNEISDGKPLAQTIMFTNSRDSKSSLAGQDTKTAAESLTTVWKSDLKLNDQEKDLIRPYAELYISDYVRLKRQLSTDGGDEFKLAYFGRSTPFPPNTPEEEIKKYEEDIKKTQNTPEFVRKKSKADLSFLELQLKYQKELTSTLGSTKEAAIKNNDPSIYHFSGIE